MRQGEAGRPDEQTEPREQTKRAVALKYSPGERTAPVVIAKGRGEVAETILKRAREHDIPIQQNASLVEVLAKLDLDQEIPPELYGLVAEILKLVYETDRQASGMEGNG
ncbi:flagellar biosynthetic protein FlhB [Paenibacillus sp. J31TS4]|uniref:EscU/YscU/HrcU family type III secretion system export apparatus switch protein n=1 Tax=Paenibacillus sp. J31TS4 TaxID=2807195 RepID=UPI001B020814|nr:EscU/YscU/HrcU family type III secretion system export apparatus switch protein [Paenibacillus sp. J31TS4]GIP36792.1 flagellar biosynthetic protein FlhB [Paenibacillus sp. J31TS4]